MIDTAATPCPHCKSTRQKYTFHKVPSGDRGPMQRRAQRVCLGKGCSWGVGLDCTWDVPLELTTVAQVRTWWIAVYG